MLGGFLEKFKPYSHDDYKIKKGEHKECELCMEHLGFDVPEDITREISRIINIGLQYAVEPQNNYDHAFLTGLAADNLKKKG